MVSSDSDFTRLATRIREDGLLVYGFGESKTPNAFIKACDRFIYTEIFKTKIEDHVEKAAPTKAAPLRDLNSDTEFRNAFDQAVNAATPPDRSRANLGTVGAHLQKLLPDFDSRNYGFQKLSDLVERIPTFTSRLR